MQNTHKTIWSRLLSETNTSIEAVLGKRLASYYQIQTVHEEKKGRSKMQYKGIKIQPNNIILKSEK